LKIEVNYPAPEGVGAVFAWQ